MTTEETKKLEEILKDEEFLKNLAEAKTDEEVKNLMATKGIIMTEQDMADYKKAVAETVEKLSKMTPEELENISGGITALEGAQIGAIGGVVVGAPLSALSVGGVEALLLPQSGRDVSDGATIICALSAYVGCVLAGATYGAVGAAIKNKMDEIKNKKQRAK